MAGTAQYVNRWSFENGATPTFSGSSDAWDFDPGSDIVKTQTILNAEGLMGSAREDVSRSRYAPYGVAGTLTCEPSPAFFGAWLTRVMGGGTATSPTLADALVEFGVLAERGADVFNYLGCIVNKMTIRGTAGGLITCAMDIIGKSEGQDVATFVGAALPSGSVAAEPFTHSDLVLTLASSARTILDFTLTIDNGAVATFANSLTAVHILRKGRRSITLEANVPCTSTEVGNLYSLAKDGAAGSLVLTNGACSTTFTFSRVQIPDNSARTQNGEIVLPVRAQIRGTALGAEMTATVDLTP